MPNEDFYAQFSGGDDSGLLISHGPRSGHVCLKMLPERLLILIEGEPEGADVTACFRDVLASDPSITAVPTLVDLTRFHGPVDWSALRAIRDMAPWGETSVAYVVRPDTMFEPILKILAMLFVSARHRIFTSPDEALAWLNTVQTTRH